MYKLLFLIHFALLITIQAIAQSPTTPRNPNLSARGSEYYKTRFISLERFLGEEDYENSLEVLIELDSLYGHNANTDFLTGVCYQMGSSKNKYKAMPYLKRALPKVSPNYVGGIEEKNASLFTYYFLAKGFHMEGKLDSAIAHFQEFKKLILKQTSDRVSPKFLDEIDSHIASCYTAKKFMSEPLNIKIDNLGKGINTIYPEYSPVVTKEGKTLYFVSKRDVTTGGLKDTKGDYYEDVFMSTLDGAEWDKAKQVGPAINTYKHEAPIGISGDGSKLLLCINEDICESQFFNNQWQRPVKMPQQINQLVVALGVETAIGTRETHAVYTPNEKGIFFTSNKAGGYGGLDIWYSEKDEFGNWKSAVNLGPEINTPLNEDAPYILQDGKTLFFCSQGHENMGGYDIFTSVLESNGTWSRPDNMGYPINTTDDDIFFAPIDDGYEGYYSSNKLTGYGDLDIYKVKILDKNKRLAYLKGIITDASTGKNVASQVEIINAETNQIIASFSTSLQKSNYLVSLPIGKTYIVVAKSPTYKTHVSTVEIPEDFVKKEITKNIELVKDPKGTFEQVDISQYLILPSEEASFVDQFAIPSSEDSLLIATQYISTNRDKIEIKKFETIKETEIKVGEIFILNNVYFDHNKAILKPESYVELDKLIQVMNTYPTIKIELSGHTDSNGSYALNKPLSENRAKACMSYLHSNGIAPDRITFVGYAAEYPIATNATDLGRRLNRRVEVKITSK